MSYKSPQRFQSDPTEIEPTLTNAGDAKMQVNIHYLINIAVNDKLDLNLVHICLNNGPLISEPMSILELTEL